MAENNNVQSGGIMLVEDNNVPAGGPMLTAVNGGTVTLRVTVKAGGSATLQTGSTYYAKTSQKSGGAVLVGSGGFVSGAQVTFTSCRGSLGGGIYNDRGTANLDYVTFSGCTANSGGAIYNNYGTVNLTSGIFSSGLNSGNSGYGGAIFNIGGTVNVSGGTFESNNILAGKSYTCRQGAAIYNISGGTMNISDAVFSGNTGQSGTIYASGGTINISDTVFCNNAGESGTIFLCGGKKGNDGFVSGAVVNLSNVVFSGNSIAIGGGIYNAMGEVNVIGGTFCGNTCTKQGAAIYHTMSGSVLRISGAVFSGNTANSRGGALDVHNAGFVISGGTFLDNAAYQYGGGAISIKGAASSFYDFYGSNVFSGNYSLSAGTATTEVHSGGAIAVMEFQGIIGTVNLDLYGTMDLLTETDTIFLQHYANAPSGNILFNFDFTKEDTSGRAKLNDWSLVSMSETGVNLGVTVNAEQSGNYIIAGNAASFDDSFTLTVGDTSIGDVSTFQSIVAPDTQNGSYYYTLTRDIQNVLTLKARSYETAEKTDRIAMSGKVVGALWDATTTYTSGAVFIVDDDYGTTELIIDNSGASGAENTVVYGGVEYGEASSTKVSINLLGGTIGAIMGGAGVNNAIGDVEVLIGGGTVAASVGEVCGAGAGIVSSGYGGATGTVQVIVTSGGIIENKLVGGALISGEDYYSEYVDGDVQLDLCGGTLGGDVIGGAQVYAVNDTTATISGKITVNVSGATFTGGSGACIYGAGWAYGDDSYSGNSDCLVGGYEKGVTVNIYSDVEIGSADDAGIFGGARADNYAWAGTENGGNVNINISGTADDKTVVHNVYGGGWAQNGGISVVNGAVNISLKDAIADVVYGGGAHKEGEDASGHTQIGEAYAGNGNVCIVIDDSDVGTVHAVGRSCENLDESNPLGDVVLGDATVQVSGNSLVQGLYGTDNDGNDGCTGSATLLMDDGIEYVDEALWGFDKVTMDGNARVIVGADAAVGTGDASSTAWTFDLTASTGDAHVAVMDWENGAGFGTDTITIKLGSTAVGWTICDLSGDDIKADAFSDATFNLRFGDGDYVPYTLGTEISGTGTAWDGYTLAYDGTTGILGFSNGSEVKGETVSYAYDGTAKQQTFTVEGATAYSLDGGTTWRSGSSYTVTRTEIGSSSVWFQTTDGIATSSLTVTRREVLLTSKGDTKVYDGTALTNDTITVTGDGFLDGDGATYTVTGSQTEVGTSANTFTYTLNDGTKQQYYHIVKQEGTLEVTAGAPDMFFACDDWSYGDAVTVKYGGFTYSGTVGDGTFSDYEDEEAPEGKTKAIAGARGFGEEEGGTLNDNFVNQVSGGYRVESEDDMPSSLYGEIELTIESGFFNKSVNGGDTLAYNGAELTREGEIEFTINGGEFRQRVAGGMFYNPASGAGQDGDRVALVDTNITMKIYGGVFHDRVYGGNNATTDALGIYTTVEGDISLTVNPDSEIVFEDCLVAGSRGKGEVLGDTSITFTGNGANLTFADDSIVWGGCSGDFVEIDGETRTIHSSVEGSRTLCFGDSDSSAFQGDFDAEVLLFTDLVIQSGSEVNFTDEDLDLQDINSWSIEIGSAADLNGANNDFTGDDFEIVGDAGSDPLTLLTADSKCDLSFDSVTWYCTNAPGGAGFTKSGDAWVYGGKQLTWTENDGKWSMTLSNVA